MKLLHRVTSFILNLLLIWNLHVQIVRASGNFRDLPLVRISPGQDSMSNSYTQNLDYKQNKDHPLYQMGEYGKIKLKQDLSESYIQVYKTYDTVFKKPQKTIKGDINKNGDIVVSKMNQISIKSRKINATYGGMYTENAEGHRETEYYWAVPVANLSYPKYIAGNDLLILLACLPASIPDQFYEYECSAEGRAYVDFEYYKKKETSTNFSDLPALQCNKNELVAIRTNYWNAEQYQKNSNGRYKYQQNPNHPFFKSADYEIDQLVDDLYKAYIQVYKTCDAVFGNPPKTIFKMGTKVAANFKEITVNGGTVKGMYGGMYAVQESSQIDYYWAPTSVSNDKLTSEDNRLALIGCSNITHVNEVYSDEYESYNELRCDVIGFSYIVFDKYKIKK